MTLWLLQKMAWFLELTPSVQMALLMLALLVALAVLTVRAQVQTWRE